MVQVTVYHNIARDPADSERRAGFLGYKPHQPLMKVATYPQSAPEWQAEDFAAQAFHLFNVGDDPSFGPPDHRALDYRRRGNRSLSVGDVVQVDNVWMACASVGWTRIDAPAWIVRDVHGSGPV